jgi:GNAT superfamily N-acetyltransferase
MMIRRMRNRTRRFTFSSVRPVETREMPACFELLQRVGRELKRQGIKQRVASLPYETYESWQHRGWNYLIQQEGFVLGIFSLPRQGFADWPDLHGPDAVNWLRTLAIAPEYQGQGCGRFAIKAALRLAKDDGPLYLDCVEGHLPAYYESAGFRRLASRSIEMDAGLPQTIVLMRSTSRS